MIKEDSYFAYIMATQNFKKPPRPLIIILDNIRSGHNVGAAFRISDAFNLQKIYLCGITPTPPHPEIRKTALGAELTIPWQYASKTTDALDELTDKGYQLIAIEQTSHSLPLHFSFTKTPPTPTALIFGHEVWGVSQEVLDRASICLEIPQYGQKKSLNVATCIAISTWEWTKKNN